jgi:hypothetical protein
MRLNQRHFSAFLILNISMDLLHQTYVSYHDKHYLYILHVDVNILNQVTSVSS